MDTRIRTGLRIPNDLNSSLIKAADNHGISKNALILQILWKWINENGDAKKGGIR
uniref:toxin-antitoxin system HicB family antitoxin n=1 Tax=Acetatifactor sp. TaxID=1872090 RepID=UPI004057B32F